MWVKTDPLMKGIATESNTGGILTDPLRIRMQYVLKIIL